MPRVAGEVPCRGEALGVADEGHQGGRGQEAYAGDRTRAFDDRWTRPGRAFDTGRSWWESHLMSRGAEAIVAALDALPPTEREEVVSELLRRVALSEHAAPSDGELTAAADQVFQVFDQRENAAR